MSFGIYARRKGKGGRDESLTIFNIREDRVSSGEPTVDKRGTQGAS